MPAFPVVHICTVSQVVAGLQPSASVRMSRSELRRPPALASASRDPQNFLRHRRNAKLLGRGFSELRHPVGGEPADPHARGALRPPIARADARQRAADAGRRDPLPGEQGHRPAVSGPGGTPAGDGAGGGRLGARRDGALDRALRALRAAQAVSARVPAGPPAPGIQPVQQDLRGRRAREHRPRRGCVPQPPPADPRDPLPGGSSRARLPAGPPAFAPAADLAHEAQRRAPGRLRARPTDPQGNRSHAPPLRRRGALRDGARQHRDHQARGRDRDRHRDPSRARRPLRGAQQDLVHRSTLRRGLPSTARHHPPAGQALLARCREVHRVPARRMTVGRLAPALLVVAALACRAPRPERPEGSCTHVQAVRQLHGAPLCEDVWTCSRPPRGRFDRIGLRRVALCDGATGPVVLYLPGMHMNAELPLVEPRHDLRLYLAEGGVRAWGLDYRTHVVPPDASPAELRALDGWTADRFADDATWATAFVRGADPGPLFVAGFSQGAVFAYRLASRRDAALAGLLILDGAPNTGPVVAGGGPAIDVGGSPLPFAERRRPLAQGSARAKPRSPTADRRRRYGSSPGTDTSTSWSRDARRRTCFSPRWRGWDDGRGARRAESPLGGACSFQPPRPPGRRRADRGDVIIAACRS